MSCPSGQLAVRGAHLSADLPGILPSLPIRLTANDAGPIVGGGVLAGLRVARNDDYDWRLLVDRRRRVHDRRLRIAVSISRSDDDSRPIGVEQMVEHHEASTDTEDLPGGKAAAMTVVVVAAMTVSTAAGEGVRSDGERADGEDGESGKRCQNLANHLFGPPRPWLNCNGTSKLC